MAIDRVQQYQTSQFLGASGKVKPYGENKAYQGRFEGVPNTTPQIASGYTDAQLEEALAYVQSGKVSSNGNIFTKATTQTKQPYSDKGSLWDGYDISNCDLNRPEQRSETVGNFLYAIG